jgi:hypothetical protein
MSFGFGFGPSQRAIKTRNAVFNAEVLSSIVGQYYPGKTNRCESAKYPIGYCIAYWAG